jgi:hypothetical protein
VGTEIILFEQWVMLEALATGTQNGCNTNYLLLFIAQSSPFFKNVNTIQAMIQT